MIQVHLGPSVRFCRAALPAMIARGHGAIINLSWIGAFLPNPGDATYCATKAYLTAFSEALQAEVRSADVRVQALSPGFTYTEFHDKSEYAGYDIHARIPRALWMSADDVVAESLAALKKGRVVCVPGFKNRVLVSVGRLGLAPLMLRWMTRRFRTLCLRRPIAAKEVLRAAEPRCARHACCLSVLYLPIQRGRLLALFS